MTKTITLNGKQIELPTRTTEVIDGKKRTLITTIEDGKEVTRILPETPKHNFCTDCGVELEPIFKATRKREDWIFKTCDVCLEEVCDDCSETDDDGNVTCITCSTRRVK